MKVLVALCALVAACSAAPTGYAYSAYSPYTPYAPTSYLYAHNPYTRFAYSVAESAPYVSYAAPAPAFAYPNSVYAYPAPAVKYVSAPAAPLVAAASVPVPVVAPVPAIKSQYHAQDSFGQARYGHDEPGQSHHAVQDAAGNKYGTFSYVKPDGKVSITQYSADHEGYKVASNDLPIAPGNPASAEPSVPIVPVVPAQPIPVFADAPVAVPAPSPVFAPVPVAVAADPSDDTIEVENVEYRAKRSVEKSRAKRSAVLPSGFLADTPEVEAAKAAHFAEHAKRSPRSPYFYAAPALPYAAYPYAAPAYPYSPISYSAYPYSAYPYSTYPYSAYPFSAPTPAVTPEGYLADTPEVAAAKAAHFAEHAIARSRARRDTSSKAKRSPAHTPASTSPLVPVVPVAPVPVVPVVPGYAPGYTANVYSRPVDHSAPIVPLVPGPVPIVTVVKTPAEAYAHRV